MATAQSEFLIGRRSDRERQRGFVRPLHVLVSLMILKCSGIIESFEYKLD